MEEIKAKQEHIQAMIEITSALTDSEFNDLEGCNDAKAMWNKLTSVYGGDEHVQREKADSLRGQLESMRMNEGENIIQYSTRLKETVNQIKGAGGTIEEKDVTSKLLRTLLPAYAIRVFAINELRFVPNMPVSLDATIGKLHAFELSNFDNSGSSINKVESAFSSFHLSESEDYNDRMSKYAEGNHSGASERFHKNMEEVHKLYEEIRKQEDFEALLARRLSRGKGKYKGKLPLKCFNCDKIGHMAYNYPDTDDEKKEYQDDRQKDNQYRRHRDFRKRERKTCLVVDEESNADKSDEIEMEEVVYVAIKDGSNEERDEEKDLISHINKNDSWIIDSGCSHHMTGDKHKFVKLEDYDGGYVRFGNDAPCLVKGKGSIRLLDNAKCDNVYWVEGLKYNLLSVAQLNNTGYRIEFQKAIVKVHDKHGKLAATRTQTRGNTIHLDSTWKNCLYAKIEDTWLWHKSFCHVNFDNLIKISKKRRVRGLLSLEKLENAIC